jgi:hypothetical protein
MGETAHAKGKGKHTGSGLAKLIRTLEIRKAGRKKATLLLEQSLIL